MAGGMALKCKRCKLEWIYKGKKKVNANYPIYTSCPKCKTSVKIKSSLSVNNGKSK